MLHWTFCSGDTGSGSNLHESHAPTVKEYFPPAGFHRKCTCQFIIRAGQEEAVKHAVFPNLMFACIVGRIFSYFSTLISLVWIILPYINLVSKSSNYYSLSSPFLCKVMVGKPGVVAPEYRTTLMGKKKNNYVGFSLFCFMGTVHCISVNPSYGLRIGHIMLATLPSN